MRTWRPTAAWLAAGTLALAGAACATPEDELDEVPYTGEDDPDDPVVQDGQGEPAPGLDEADEAGEG